MAQQYFRCTRCHQVVLLTYRAAEVDDPNWPGRCECRGNLERSPRPGDFAMDASSGPGFKAFTINRDGQRVVVDSLSKLRSIERDSEQRYRNGEGEPLRFRMWNQTRSNKDVGSFGTEGQIGTRTYGSGEPLVKGGRVSIKRHGQDAPDVITGPGVSSDGSSPL